MTWKQSIIFGWFSGKIPCHPSVMGTEETACKQRSVIKQREV